MSVATLLGVSRVCHPPPESLVRKQILESYEQVSVHTWTYAFLALG